MVSRREFGKEDFEQVQTRRGREPFPSLPLRIRRKPDSLSDDALEDFEVLDHQQAAAIKATVAV